MLGEVQARLEAEIAELAGRVFDAADFSRLMARGSLPTAPITAHVLPLGFQGSPASAAAGSFTQPIRETIGIVLMVNSNDRAGDRALAELEPLLRRIMEAIAGWAPEDTVGVFELVRANIINPGTGRLAYQIEFAVNDQLRILS